MSRWHNFDGIPDLPENAFRSVGGRFGGKLMTLEGGKGSAPAPDPRMGEAALKQVDLNSKIYDDYRAIDAPWMKDIANRALGITETNAARAGEMADYQFDMTKKNDERYWSTTVPFENQLLEDAKRFDSQGYKNQQVASALGDVQQQFSNASAQQARGLARMGVNPNSGKFAAAQSGLGIEQAKAMAGAANKTRMAADQIGLSTKMQMYGGLKGLAGLGATNAGLAINATGTGNSSAVGMTGAAGSYLNANNSAVGTMNSGVQSGLTSYGNYINSAQNAVKINNDSDPFASLLGAGAQLGAAWIGASDVRLKKNIVLVGKDERTGLNLYEFEYIYGDGTRYQGVMAQEVLEVMPEAVLQDKDGFLAVDYGKLGIDMLVVEGEMA